MTPDTTDIRLGVRHRKLFILVISMADKTSGVVGERRGYVGNHKGMISFLSTGPLRSYSRQEDSPREQQHEKLQGTLLYTYSKSLSQQ